MVQKNIPPSLKPILSRFEESPDHVVVTDAAGKIIYANPAAELHTGYSIAEMLGKKPGDLWGGQMPDDFYATMWKSIEKEGLSFVAELRNKRKNGDEYWQEIHIIPVVNRDGKSEYYIGVELAVSDEDRRQKLVQNMENSAVDEDAALKICWPLGWLLESASLRPEQMALLNRHYKDDGTLHQLTVDLISISNIIAANKFADTAFSAEDAVKSLLDDVSKRFRDRQFFLDAQKKSGLEVFENKKIFEELLRRVLENAARYTQPGTGEIVVSMGKVGDSLIIRCKDNGIGMEPQELDRIFTKYYRGMRARQLMPSGSGLGLYIVKHIADLRGWKVSIESTLHVGTTFTVEIPLHGRQTLTS